MTMEACILLGLIVCCTFSVGLAQNQECQAEPEQRPCESYQDKERWFFNRTSGKCDSFDWRTCTTGSNSFSHWQDCQHACVCQLPPQPTPCDNNWRFSHSRYFFNKDSNVCEPFPEGSGECSLNGNAFMSESSCRMTCVCSLPLDRGTGDGQESAFFFNSDSHRCERFAYTGQGGNANRFISEEQCKDRCLCGMSKKPADNEPTCLAYMPSVFYNSSSGQCENFIYGGCNGNNNRFPTMSECQDTCP